jgi:chromosome segregation ATPase
MQEQRERLRNDVSDLKGNHSQAQQRIRDLESTVRDLRSEVAHADEQRKKKEADHNILRQQREATLAELSKCKQRLQAVEEDLHQARERAPEPPREVHTGGAATQCLSLHCQRSGM